MSSYSRPHLVATCCASVRTIDLTSEPDRTQHMRSRTSVRTRHDISSSRRAATQRRPQLRFRLQCA
eukprot:3169546-Rhodomonas_salina.1